MPRIDPRVNAYRSDLADFRLKGLVHSERFVEGQPYRIAVPQAPVRRDPSADAMLLTEALWGEQVRVFETNSAGWAWAQLDADRYVGWIPADALAEGPSSPTHKVSASRTFAFGAPDIKKPPLLSLPLGTQVEVTGAAHDKNADYALIAPAGAVVTQHLAPLDAAASDWTSVAEQFLGTPYLWGGKTDMGIDCSGLVQVALQACGIPAPRDSDMQEAELGAPLPLGGGWPELRRGDLVFWAGHVGIMRDGENLLHGNAYHMAVAVEPLTQAVVRLAGRGAPMTSIRRIERE